MFIKRTLLFSLSLVFAFIVALLFDDDFPELIRGKGLIHAVLVFGWFAKWAIMAGGLVFLALYRLVGSPFTMRKQVVVFLASLLLGSLGPLLLFDVSWHGGPIGAKMSVWPTLYRDMRPLFALCGVAFLGFYNLAFFIVPNRGPTEAAT